MDGIDEQLIGKITLTFAIGTPTAWWIGKVMAAVMIERIKYWAYQEGYCDGLKDLENDNEHS